MRFDQPEATHRVVQSEHPLWPSQVSHDGQWLFYVETHPVTGADIWVVGLNPVVPPRAILQTPANEGFPVLSSDGRWLAYSVREGNGGVAYVQPFPGPGERVPVSSVSGRRLGWTARGDGLLTASESGVFVTAIDGRGPRIVVGATEVFTDQRTFGWSPPAALQVDRSTGRLLATIRTGRGPEASVTTPASLQLITNGTALFEGGRKP
jgi:Tol biopolymer transport system component